MLNCFQKMDFESIYCDIKQVPLHLPGENSLNAFASNQKFDCRLCSFTSASKDTIEIHIQGHQHEKLYHSSYECRECAQWLLSEKNLTMHFETHIKKEPNDRNDLDDPLLETSEGPLIKDEEKIEIIHSVSTIIEAPAEESFDVQNFLCYETEEDESNFTMEPVDNKSPSDNAIITQKGFTRKKLLNQNRLKETNDKIFNCKECSKRFYTEGLLSAHVETHTNIAEHFSCKICSSTFTTSAILKRHLTTHMESEQEFECEQCSKKFLTEYAMQSHMETHSQVFECKSCLEKFLTLVGLVRHKNLCPATIGKISLDNLHKLPQCSICMRFFRTENQLQTHMHKIHLAGKPFGCGKCLKTFDDPCVLQNHMKRHAKGLTFKCVICRKIYTSKHGLSQHFKRRHLPCTTIS